MDDGPHQPIERSDDTFDLVQFRAADRLAPSATEPDPGQALGRPMPTTTRPDTQPTDPRSNVGLTSGTP